VQLVDLVPCGGEVAVTNANVGEYVDRYVEWALELSIASQFDCFRKGFVRVCGGQALEMFQPEELELLICGNPVLDFESLEQVCVGCFLSVDLTRTPIFLPRLLGPAWPDRRVTWYACRSRSTTMASTCSRRPSLTFGRLFLGV
jgi:hypothetical protein